MSDGNNQNRIRWLVNNDEWIVNERASSAVPVDPGESIWILSELFYRVLEFSREATKCL